MPTRYWQAATVAALILAVDYALQMRRAAVEATANLTYAADVVEFLGADVTALRDEVDKARSEMSQPEIEQSVAEIFAEHATAPTEPGPRDVVGYLVAPRRGHHHDECVDHYWFWHVVVSDLGVPDMCERTAWRQGVAGSREAAVDQVEGWSAHYLEHAAQIRAGLETPACPICAVNDEPSTVENCDADDGYDAG